LISGAAFAQATMPTAIPATQSEPTNMLESAVLVLTYTRQPVALQSAEQFAIRMDAGKPFHPTALHLEGEEPLNIAFLIDDSRDPFKALGRFGSSLAALVPGALHPADHVTIYALDCTVARTMDHAPADAETLKNAVANGLAYGKLHGTGTKPACSGSLRLWDFAAVAIEALGNQPGRRVLVIVSGGNDKKSTNDWKAVKGSALDHSVAIFGLRDQTLFDNDAYAPKFSPGSKIGAGTSNQVAEAQSITKNDPRPFDLLCGNTGGMVINTTPNDMGDRLNELIRALRGRYILQFPRGGYVPGGSHTFKISVENTALFTTAAGANEIGQAAATP
jgi:hypothetical protein